MDSKLAFSSGNQDEIKILDINSRNLDSIFIKVKPYPYSENDKVRIFKRIPPLTKSFLLIEYPPKITSIFFLDKNKLIVITSEGKESKQKSYILDILSKKTIKEFYWEGTKPVRRGEKLYAIKENEIYHLLMQKFRNILDLRRMSRVCNKML